jgi:ATP-dependent helicase/nuclease subunit A
MMSDYYTNASDPNKNIWVSASAGSGKTKLLVDRVIKLLMHGQELQNILCITFTNNAAHEMLHRLKHELTIWFSSNNEQLIQKLVSLNIEPNDINLQKARKLIFKIIDHTDTINIKTIHSLCQDILTKFPIEANLGFATKLIDENEKEIFLKKAKRNLLSSELLNDPYIDILIKNMSEFSFSQLIDLILSFDNKSIEWINIEETYSDFIQKIDKSFNIINNLDYSDIQQIFLNFISYAKNYSEIKVIQQVTAYIKNGSNMNDPENLDEIINSIKKLFYTIEGKPKVRILLSNEKKKFPELENSLCIFRDKIQNFIDQKNTIFNANLSKGLCKLKKLIDSHYSEIKHNNSLIDFNDIVVKSYLLLNNPEIKEWIKYKLGYRYKHVLVDESQDTNLLQWKVIFTLIEEFFYQTDTSLFIVGDEKQSIYSFQGSSPILYQAIEKIFVNNFFQSQRSIQKINLNYSFRTGQLILDFVDIIFKKINNKYSEPITTNYLNHLSKSSFQNNFIEIYPVIINPNIHKNNNKEWKIPVQRIKPYDPAKKTALIIATKINYLLSKSLYRPEEIMILVRKRDKFSQFIISECKKLSIPITGMDKIKLSDNIAIQDLIAFAKFILYPYDDLNLAALLKSPIFNYDETQIFNLCYNRESTIWQRINTDPTYSELKVILKFYLSSSLRNNLYDLYSDLLHTRNYKQNFIARLGSEVEEILDEFLNICQKYQNDYHHSLELFISWLENSQIELKRSLNNYNDQVKIMTIHGAKGLQSKLIILADAVSVPSSTNNLFWDSQANIPIFNGNSENSSKIYLEKKQFHKTQILNEYFRLLYVVLTRAQNHLIIFGYCNQNNIKEESWYRFITEAAKEMGNKIQLEKIESIPISDNNVDFINCLEPIKYEIGKIINEPCEIKNDENKINSNSQKLPKLSKKPFIVDEVKFQENKSKDLHKKRKGILIHKILEMIVGNECQELENLINRLTKFYNITLSKEEILNFISFYNILKPYTSTSIKILKEQPLLNDNEQYSKSIIDLMIICEQKIIIIDYKNAAYNPENQNKYIQQLNLYKKSIQNIFTNHEIECYIAWIQDLNFEKIF